MGYIESHLVSGERVVFTTKLHWWVIIAYTIRVVFAFSITIFALLVVLPMQSTAGRTIGWNSLIPTSLICASVLALPLVLFGIINYFTSEFGVTNRRVLIKTGIIRRKTLELNLGKVESFQVRESLLGRILGYKRLVLTGSGGTNQSFSYVANANTFRRTVVELSTNENTGGYYTPLNPYPSVARTPVAPHYGTQVDLPSETSQNTLQQALQMIQNGDRHGAQRVVRSLLQTQPYNADVWYMAGYLSTSMEKKRQAYQKALTLNPSHAKAQEALASLAF